MTLGKRLRAALERAGMSAEGMGRHLGIAGSAVRKWCLGSTEPDIGTLARFADRAGASLVWLVEGDVAPSELAEWAVAFADLIVGGADPVVALGAVSAGAAVLSGPEARLLEAAAEGMRAVLDELAPAPWRELTLRQKREVLALVERLAEENRRSRLLRRRVRRPDE